MSVSGSDILSLFSKCAVCLFPSQVVKRSCQTEKPIRVIIRFNNTIARWSRCIIQLTAMLGYLMLVGSQKPYLYLEVPTKRFFNDCYHNTSIIVHLMWFPAVSEKKWKWVQIKMWNDVKGISKVNGHALKMVFIAQ